MFDPSLGYVPVLKYLSLIYFFVAGRCMDMEAEHKQLNLRNAWSQVEREAFRDKYLQHPKNFGQIASFLPRKSVRDCVR